MSHHNKYKNESQDARRRDKHNATHPDEKVGVPRDKEDPSQSKDFHSPNKRK